MKARVGKYLALVFAVLSALHVWWAIFGIPTRVPVIPSIPGGKIGIPTAVASLSVAAALALAALVSLAVADVVLAKVPRVLRRIAAGIMGLVFVVRAVGDFYLLGFFKTVRTTSFAVWDYWLYSPLCLAIGLAALWLVFRARDAPAVNEN